MENVFLKTDYSVINEKYIKWVRKMNNCLEVCMKSDGCIVGKTTHQICKLNTPDSYNKLNKHFE